MSKETDPRPIDVSRVFTYPPSAMIPYDHRICRKGQRRAAYEALRLYNQGNAEFAAEIKGIYRRADMGEKALKSGISPHHQLLISLIVRNHSRQGTLPMYVDHQGNYLEGRSVENNTHLSDASHPSDIIRNIHEVIKNGEELEPVTF